MRKSSSCSLGGVHAHNFRLLSCLKKGVCAVLEHAVLLSCVAACACVHVGERQNRQGVGMEAQETDQAEAGQGLCAACLAQGTRVRPERVCVGCRST